MVDEPLLIESIGPQGDGLSRTPEGTVFIERTLPGERVRARVRPGAGGVLRGELVEIAEASAHRIQAPCVNYEICGGCSLQHADESLYQEWKADIVRRALAKAGVTPEVWRDPVFLPAGTRRRVTFAALRKGKSVTLGYNRRRTHQVTDIAVCPVADPAVMAVRAKLIPVLASMLRGGKPADVFIQTVDGQSEVVITGAIGQKGVPDLAAFEAAGAAVHDAGLARIAWRAGERDAPEMLVERNPLLATFGDLNVALPPLAFLQPTKAGEDALAAAVMAALPSKGRFADLFSGCGTFAGRMLVRGTVDAFETAAPAVRALERARGAKALQAIQRDLVRNPLSADEAQCYDAIVFDPPRAGAQEQARMLAESEVPRLVAVSCNPGTFARDARILLDGGYALESAQVVDQFIWSHHVELVAVFTR